MIFTDEQVRNVADLANLRLTDVEIKKMAVDLGAVVTYMKKLDSLDTTNVEPMAQVLYEAEETATLREDIERPTIPNADVLRSAAVSGGGYFKIPRVIER